MARRTPRTDSVTEAPQGGRRGERDGGTGSLVGLKILVFVAGAVLMALEIAGSRVLAPHFGNSVFVWGSLISVFLTALSLGYWVGGVLADRRPTLVALEGICLGVAALIFLIPWIGHPLAGTLLELGFQERGGPIVAAILLFLPPSFLLGMVSPWSVRIAARDVASIGRAAGSLYALSTMGSIAGTLLTTFVLIPTLGVTWILRALALAMVLVPVGLVLASGRARGLLTAALIAAIGLALPTRPASALTPEERLVFEAETPYHRIQVTDLSGRVRLLRFDRFVESSIDLQPPHATASPYTSYFHLAFLLRPEMERALFIGAGGGIGPRTFLEQRPEMVVDVVDIDRAVIEAAHDLFFMPRSEHVRTFARDGRMFLRACEGGYDAIVLDAFTIGGRIPFHLATREAFELARTKLAAGGLFVMNVNGSIAGERSGIVRSIDRTLREAFPHVQALAHEWRIDPSAERGRNVIFVASTEPLPERADWLLRAARVQPRSSVDAASYREMVRDLLPEGLPESRDAVLFTDDHAPIETMSF